MAKKIEKLIYTNERGESITFSHASIFHTNEVSGLSDVRNEIYSINSMGQDGDTYLGNRIQSREIEIVGSIRERDKDRMRDYRRQMNRVLNPQYSATLTYEYGDFRRVINKRWGIKINVRITEVAETYQQNMEEIDITFGESLPALITQIRQITK